MNIENSPENASDRRNDCSSSPPKTENAPDFDHNDRIECEHQLDVLSAVLRHPASMGKREIELTEALVKENWCRRDEHAMKGLRYFQDSNVLQLDLYRPSNPFDDLPPTAA